MAHTYEELKGKTIDELREIAKGLEHEAVKGYTQMNKEHLLPALCKALGIEYHKHTHHAAVHHHRINCHVGGGFTWCQHWGNGGLFRRQVG